LLWTIWGLFYLFGFRRAESAYIRSLRKYNGIAWIGITVWMIYCFVLWARTP